MKVKHIILPAFILILFACGSENKGNNSLNSPYSNNGTENGSIDNGVNNSNDHSDHNHDNPNNNTPTEEAAPTTISFEEMEYDFGDIEQGSSHTHIFKFKNTGEEDYIITNAQGSCGCTVPNYPKTPIAPGEEAEIEVTFNSSGKSNRQDKTVTITGNTDPKNIILHVKSNVIVPEQ